MMPVWKTGVIIVTTIVTLYFSIISLPEISAVFEFNQNNKKNYLFIIISLIFLAASSLYYTALRTLNRERAVLKEVSFELSKSNQRLRGIFNGTKDGIIYTNEEGVIEDINTEIESMSGYRKQDLLGQNIEILIPENIKPHHKNYLKNSNIKNKKILGESRQIYCRHKNGHNIPVEITITKLSIDNQRKYIGIIRDVSELLKDKEALKDSLLREEQLGDKKIQLLSSASHELRTPLNAIIGFTSLLIHTNSTNTAEQRLTQLNDIEKSAELLLLLVNDLLCYSKIDSGNISIQKSTFDLKDIIEECIKIKKTDISNSQITIKNQVTDDVIIESDKLRMKQIIINLLSNAIKYNNTGGQVLFYIEVKEQGIKLYIADNGMGIPEQKQEQLFTPFTRLHSDRLDIEGSGIGLALSKNIINSLGGDISYSPNKQGGSTFTLSIPNAIKQSITIDQRKPAKKHYVSSILAKLKLLYVEDNAVNVRLMEAILNSIGVSMEHVYSGEACLEYIGSHPVDIILMDINLPGMSGIDCANTIKNNRQYGNCPIIAVSASITKYHESYHRIFSNSISKPFRPEKLIAALEQAALERTSSPQVELMH